MYFYIPNNLNVDKLIEAYPPDIPTFKKEKLLFIIDSIMMGMVNGRENSDGYVTLNATVLTDILGNHYNQHVHYLRHTQIIEQYFGKQGEAFLIGVHSMAYRLKAKYLTPVTPYELTDFALERRIRSYMKAEAIRARLFEAQEKTKVDEEASRDFIPGQGFNFDRFFDPAPETTKKAVTKAKKIKNRHKSDVLNRREFLWDDTKFKGMYKWLKDGRLSMNRELVDAYLKTRLAVEYVDPSGISWDEDEPEKAIVRYNKATIHAHEVENETYGTGFFDNSIKRYYNVVSLMPKMLRHALTYKGENLAVIDIANCQPYMSNLFFKPAFWENEEATHLKLSDLGIISDYIFTPTSFSSFIMFLKSASNPTQISISLNYMRYKVLTSRGRFYDYVNRNIGQLYGFSHYNSNIQEVKKELFTLYFSKRGFGWGGDATFKDGFKRLFPTVYEVFAKIKESNRHNLAHIYFIVETYIVYHRIVKRIQKELPKVPFWTIHDGIASTVEGAAAIRPIMDEELTKAIGIKPKLNVELFEEGKIHVEIARYEAIIEKKGLAGKIDEAVAKGEILYNKL